MKKKRMKILSIFLTMAVLVSSLSASVMSAFAADVLYGDADGDGSIAVADATAIQKYLVRIDNEGVFDIDFADMNGDNKVSIFDATLIQIRLVKAQ